MVGICRMFLLEEINYVTTFTGCIVIPKVILDIDTKRWIIFTSIRREIKIDAISFECYFMIHCFKILPYANGFYFFYCHERMIRLI